MARSKLDRKRDSKLSSKSDLKKSIKMEESKAAKRAVKEEHKAKKGQRGKKLCPSCDELMPIHCQYCKNCNHEFHMNHKPKKVKEQLLSSSLFSLTRTAVGDGSLTLTLTKSNFYGTPGGKQYKRERQLIPPALLSNDIPLPGKLAKTNSTPIYAFSNSFLGRTSSA